MNVFPNLLVVYYVTLSAVALLTLIDAAHLPWALKLLKELTEHGKRYRPVSMPSSSMSVRRFASTISFSSLLSLRFPKSWFSHFYAVGLVTASAAIYVSSPFQSCFVCYLLLAHLARRLFECLFIFDFGDSTISSAAYLLGMLHYVLLPFALSDFSRFSLFVVDVDSRTMFSALPTVRWGSLYAKGGGEPINYNPIVCLLGVVIFAVSNVGQHVTHRHLAAMRGRAEKGGRSGKGGGGEVIASNTVHNPNPEQHSVLFAYSTCPHYSFEIGLYLGLLIADHSTVLFEKASFICACVRASLLLFVCCNLGVSATMTHEWYATERKKRGTKGDGAKWVIVPFVY